MPRIMCNSDELESKPGECPACGATRQSRPYGNIPSLFRCTGCGLLSRSPSEISLILEANIDAFNGMPQGWWETMYDGWNARERGRILPSGHASRAALEVGPGRGGFISYLQRNGYRVEGVDISSAICSDLENRFHVTMTRGTLEDYPADSRFDLISAHHVVEHLQNLSVFLAKCRSLLSREGYLLVSCPNAGSWAAEFRSWPGYEPYHSYFFTLKTLSKVLERNEFTVESVRIRQPYTGWWNVLFRELMNGGKPGTIGKYGPNRYGRYARFLFNLLRFAGSAILFPLSVITSIASKGEEIVIIASKADIPGTKPAGLKKERG